MLKICREVFYISKSYKKCLKLANNPAIAHSKWLHVSSIYCKNRSDDEKAEIPGAVSGRYEVFQDDSPVVLDVEEERKKAAEQLPEDAEEVDRFHGISPERGKTGVLEIEEVITILKREKAIDITVIQIPQEFSYVDYLVLMTTRSNRQMVAISEYVRRVFKYKRHKKDVIPKVEGEGSKDWMAIDLGNIALHLFSSQARKHYDVDTLWSVGFEHDSLYNAPSDSFVDLQEQLLKSLAPALDNKESIKLETLSSDASETIKLESLVPEGIKQTESNLDRHHK